ncbi:hypothetical protein FIBSPDRAFT_1037123 [Athelia psychrophila]|uniref:G domain-containing protein n=1 Tax=Athelia psychrophila TaxID=1759441 RepID=A0A166UT95_9AGAM|nr:hypothetical protein FIBSPDRAFT_1037123 [Fibularhizoctonia sp. CBS 109695]
MAQTSNGARYVIVMGPTGSGKNYFIWKASGQGEDRVQEEMATPVDPPEGRADRVPIECNHPIQGSGRPPVIFVDTAGFVDLQTSWLDSLFEPLNKDIKDNNGELAGIILLHQIAPNQIPLSTIHRQLQTLQDLCGMDVMRNVVVATTMWDSGVSDNTARKRHADVQAALVDGTIKGGCKLEEFRGTKDSAWKSIDYLLNQQPCTPILVQQETVVQQGTDQVADIGCWKRLFPCC